MRRRPARTGAPTVPLSDDTLARQRYRVRDLLPAGDVEIANAITLYVRASPRARVVLQHYGILAAARADPAEFRAWLIDLVGVVKQWQMYGFFYLEGLKDAVNDYKPVTLEIANELALEVRNWVQDGETFHPKSERLWAGVLRRVARPVAYVANPPPVFRDWLDNPENWANSGAAGTRIPYKGIERTKWAVAYTYSTNELLALCSATTAVHKAIPKRERGKVRLVVNGDLGLYLLQAYVSAWYEPALRGSAWSPIFSGVRGMVALTRETMAVSRSGGRWLVPLDESHFDYTKRLTDQVMLTRFLRSFILSDSSLKTDVARSLAWACDAIISKLSNGSVVFDAMGVTATYPHRKGLISGMRWTALYDTLLNRAQVEYFKLEYRLPGVSQTAAQGDDGDLAIVSRAQVVGLLRAYADSGLVANPRKFWVASPRRTDVAKGAQPHYLLDRGGEAWPGTEFLRRFICGNGGVGYPARGITTLLYRNPVRPPNENRLQLLTTEAAGWFSLMSRLQEFGALDMAIEDLTHVARASPTTIRRWLHTPTTFGGFGWWPWGPAAEWVGAEAVPDADQTEQFYPDARGQSSAYWRTVLQSSGTLARGSVRFYTPKYSVRFVRKLWPGALPAFFPWPDAWPAFGQRFDVEQQIGRADRSELVALLPMRVRSDLVPLAKIVVDRCSLGLARQWLLRGIQVRLPRLVFVSSAYADTFLTDAASKLIGHMMRGTKRVGKQQYEASQLVCEHWAGLELVRVFDEQHVYMLE
jgi:hypothetical protein